MARFGSIPVVLFSVDLSSVDETTFFFPVFDFLSLGWGCSL